jgi:hypothetical protein
MFLEVDERFSTPVPGGAGSMSYASPGTSVTGSISEEIAKLHKYMPVPIPHYDDDVESIQPEV